MLELEEIVDQWGVLRSKLVRDNENIFHAINDLEMATCQLRQSDIGTCCTRGSQNT